MHTRTMVILVTLKGNYFLYFQVFSKILGLSTMTLPSRSNDPTWWQSTFSGTNAKAEKVLKKAEMGGMEEGGRGAIYR